MSHTVLCEPPNLASFKKVSHVRKLDIQRQRRSFLNNTLETTVRHQTIKQTNEHREFLVYNLQKSMSHTVLCVPPTFGLLQESEPCKKARQRRSFLSNSLETRVRHQSNKQTNKQTNIENFGISSSEIYESYCALCASKLGLLQESEPKVI